MIQRTTNGGATLCWSHYGGLRCTLRPGTHGGQHEAVDADGGLVQWVAFGGAHEDVPGPDEWDAA